MATSCDRDRLRLCARWGGVIQCGLVERLRVEAMSVRQRVYAAALACLIAAAAAGAAAPRRT